MLLNPFQSFDSQGMIALVEKLEFVSMYHSDEIRPLVRFTKERLFYLSSSVDISVPQFLVNNTINLRKKQRN